MRRVCAIAPRALTARVVASSAPTALAAVAAAPLVVPVAQRRWQSVPHPGNRQASQQPTYGRVSDEDRRWWMVHLECCPDVTPGTFHTWLDGVGTHTAKKLVERNIWTIEQVAALSSDQVDELRFKDGCGFMDVAWEHARTVVLPLKSREVSATGESAMQSRILEIRRKRELARRREEIIEDKRTETAQREETLRKLREAVAAKREALRRAQQKAAQRGDGGGDADEHVDVGAAVDKEAPPKQ